MKRLSTICLMLSVAFLNAAAQDILRDSLDFDAQISESPASMLEGKLSGLYITGEPDSPTALLRSISGGTFGSDPLWIVDGAVLGRTSDACVGSWRILNPLAFLNTYDIESISILKEQSRTAMYGSRGANGVIIIKTHGTSPDGNRFIWNSNLGYSNGIDHNHSLRFSSAKNNSDFNLSAFFRSASGSYKGYGGMNGGLRASYDTKTNSKVWFGISAIISAGSAHTPDLDESNLYNNDFDDRSRDLRSVESAWLQFNITKGLSLRAGIGADYRNLSRYIWYGAGTEIGAGTNGSANILSSSRLEYNGSLNLSWQRHFRQMHKLYLNLGGEAFGNITSDNDMPGTDFFTHSLGAKGLNLHGDKTKFKRYENKHFSAGVLLAGSYSYKDIAGAKADIRADWTPRYCDGKPRVFYSGEIFGKPCKGLQLSVGYGVSGTEMVLPFTKNIDLELQPFHEGLGRTESREINFAIAFEALAGRLSGKMGVFHKKTVESFTGYRFGEPGETYLWITSPRKEVLSESHICSGCGVELDLNGTVLKTKNLTWTANINLTYTDRRNALLPLPAFTGGLGSTLTWKALAFDFLCDAASGKGIEFFSLRRISASYDFGMVKLTAGGHFPVFPQKTGGMLGVTIKF